MAEPVNFQSHKTIKEYKSNEHKTRHRMKKRKEDKCKLAPYTKKNIKKIMQMLGMSSLPLVTQDIGNHILLLFLHVVRRILP